MDEARGSFKPASDARTKPALILPIKDGDLAAKRTEGPRGSAEDASKPFPTGEPVGPSPPPAVLPHLRWGRSMRR